MNNITTSVTFLCAFLLIGCLNKSGDNSDTLELISKSEEYHAYRTAITEKALAIQAKAWSPSELIDLEGIDKNFRDTESTCTLNSNDYTHIKGFDVYKNLSCHLEQVLVELNKKFDFRSIPIEDKRYIGRLYNESSRIN